MIDVHLIPVKAQCAFVRTDMVPGYFFSFATTGTSPDEFAGLQQYTNDILYIIHTDAISPNEGRCLLCNQNKLKIILLSNVFNTNIYIN